MADEHAGFVERYHQMVDKLDRTGRSDPDTMWLLGSVAAGLVTSSGAQSWTELKLMLDEPSLKDFVQSLNVTAATYDAAEKPKGAYVARLLGMSLVASQVADPRTQQRDQLLNRFIDTAAEIYITDHTNAQAAAKG